MMILMAGSTGLIDSSAAHACAADGVPVVVTSRKRNDLAGDKLAAESDLIRRIMLSKYQIRVLGMMLH